MDKGIGKTSMLVRDFWRNVVQRSENHDPSIRTSGGFEKKMDDVSAMVQRHDGEGCRVLPKRNLDIFLESFMDGLVYDGLKGIK